MKVWKTTHHVFHKGLHWCSFYVLGHPIRWSSEQFKFPMGTHWRWISLSRTHGVVYDERAYEARIDGDYNKRHFISEVCTTRRCAQHDKKAIDRANVTTRRASPSLLHHHKINMGFSPFSTPTDLKAAMGMYDLPTIFVGLLKTFTCSQHFSVQSWTAYKILIGLDFGSFFLFMSEISLIS